MIIVNDLVEQGSLAWQELRFGVVTASRIDQLISSVGERTWYGDCGTKHGTPEIAQKCRKCSTDAMQAGLVVKLSEQRRRLLRRLVAEWATQEPAEDFGGVYWTERGNALEDQARAYFELQTGLHVRTVPFIYKDDTKLTGCSPDGVIYGTGDESGGGPMVGGLELKCPNNATHIGYMLANHEGEDIPYQYQVQFSLWVTGLPEWWFMSYYPGLPPVLRKVTPDANWQDAFDTHVPKFLDEIQKAKDLLKTMGVKTDV